MKPKSPSAPLGIGVRISYILISLGLVGYGLVGLLANDLYVPGKYSQRGIHLHGTSALLMFIAMFCWAANLLSSVVDYYDKRDNKRRSFARICGFVDLTLFGLALALLSIYLQTIK